MTSSLRWVALVPAALLAGCATTTTYSRSYEPGPPAALEGRVESVREVVRRTEGDPGGGAIGGALIGGLLGGAITGRGAGALVGAIGGAATGAAVSGSASSEQRWYEVRVRFDDGSWGRIDYGAPPPFRVGDRVRQSPRGLAPAGRPPPPRGPPREPPPDDEPPEAPPPPPPAELPPPPG